MASQRGAVPIPPERQVVIGRDVDRWLSNALGLTLEPFDEAATKARMEWSTCTDLDPVYHPGSHFAATCVRYLRMALIPKKWTLDNTKNVARTLHPNGRVCILVETGDEFTGTVGTRQPSTNSKKGTVVLDAVDRNIELFDEHEAKRKAREVEGGRKAAEMLTFFYLVRIDDITGTVYRELSIPMHDGTSENDEKKHITDWRLRVILPPLGNGGEPPRLALPVPAPAPSITITRKQA